MKTYLRNLKLVELAQPIRIRLHDTQGQRLRWHHSTGRKTRQRRGPDIRIIRHRHAQSQVLRQRIVKYLLDRGGVGQRDEQVHGLRVVDDLVLDGRAPVVHVVLVVAEGGIADVGFERLKLGLHLGVADQAVAGTELLVVVSKLSNRNASKMLPRVDESSTRMR